MTLPILKPLIANAMNQLIKAFQNENTYTENGMVTNSSSLDACVDLFFLAGASRRLEESQIESLIEDAFLDDPEIAMKIIFWARDVRGGAGERRFFRIALKYMNHNFRDELKKVLPLVPEYGRWDDLFIFGDGSVKEDVKELIRQNLVEEQNGLLAKWLPRKGPFANTIRKHLKLDPKSYRKLLVEHSQTVEQQMCAGEWTEVVYSKVPSQAMHKYRKAFFRNDQTRFNQFIARVKKGEDKINAGAIFPYQLYQAMAPDLYEKKLPDHIVAQWNALPNYMEGSTQRLLPVCDTSGSMTGIPMDVSISLGLYIAERNESVFKDAFITFSHQPNFQYLKGDLYKRCIQLARSGHGYNTDLEAVFRVLLQKAVEFRVKPEEMPTKILIISDMEFDQAVQRDQSAIRMIRTRYENAGYEVPGVIFWNVKGRMGNVPVRSNDKGTALVSGFSPSILKAILAGGGGFTPQSIMMETIMSDRYAAI